MSLTGRLPHGDPSEEDPFEDSIVDGKVFRFDIAMPKGTCTLCRLGVFSYFVRGAELCQYSKFGKSTLTIRTTRRFIAILRTLSREFYASESGPSIPPIPTYEDRKLDRTKRLNPSTAVRHAIYSMEWSNKIACSMQKER